MPINNITQTISELPAAGRRGVDVQSLFVTKQEDFQDHLQGTTVTELNTLKDQLNSRIGEINSTATTMNGYADTALAGASTATTKAGEASTSASGALTSRNQAETFKNNASTSATKASQWSDNNYNVEVETGRYSAKHWATVAENFGGDTVKLAGNQTVDGVKTFSSNIVGNITGNAATATTASNSNKLIDKNWYWSGQGGQPTWVWGGSDGTNMYVYNPSNFSVNYANTAGVANNAIGYGQTWQDVTASRAAGTTYTNSTGKPIIASVYGYTSIANEQVNSIVNGVTIPLMTTNSSAYGGFSIIIPLGASYSISGAASTFTAVIWFELR